MEAISNVGRQGRVQALRHQRRTCPRLSSRFHGRVPEEGFEHRPQGRFGHVGAALDGVAPIHEDLGFDDRDQPALLAQGGVAGESMGIGREGGGGGSSVAHGDDRPPLGEACAEGRVDVDPLPEPVQAFRDRLRRVAGQGFGAGVNLDAGKDSEVLQ